MHIASEYSGSIFAPSVYPRVQVSSFAKEDQGGFSEHSLWRGM